MSASYKTKVRVSQQYQQVRHETLKVLPAADLSTIASNFSSMASDLSAMASNLCGSSPFTKNTTKAKNNASFKYKERSTLPFSFPKIKDDPEKSEMINKILLFSLRLQRKEDISYSDFIIILISQCLKAVGIDNQVDSGYRCLPGEAYPHIWLVIDGYIIDNIHNPELPESSMKYLCKNTPKCYKRCDLSGHEPESPNIKLDISSESLPMVKSALALSSFCRKNPDRALALGLNREQLFHFYFSMIRHMYDVYGVCITGIDPKIRFKCWWCGHYPESGKPFLSDIVGTSDYKEVKSSSKSTWKLSQCGNCMVASYCNSDCQQLDWAACHKIACLPRGNAYIPPSKDHMFSSDSYSS